MLRYLMQYLTQWAGRRVVVTGGSGFLGKRVIDLGHAAGVDLHSLSRSYSENDQAVFHTVDLTNEEQVRAAIAEIRPDAVLHLASAGVAYGPRALSTLLNTNVTGLAHLFSALESEGLSIPVVMVGTGYEYAPQTRPVKETDALLPTTPYSLSKILSLQLAGYFAGKFPITFVRFFNLYGQDQHTSSLLPYIIESARHQRPIELTKCEQIRDFMYVDDAAASLWHVLSSAGTAGAVQVINVATGVPAVLRSVVLQLGDLLQEKGFSPQFEFGARPYRTDESMFFVADVSKMRAVLSWEPTTSLLSGLRQTLDFALQKEI